MKAKQREERLIQPAREEVILVIRRPEGECRLEAQRSSNREGRIKGEAKQDGSEACESPRRHQQQTTRNALRNLVLPIFSQLYSLLDYRPWLASVSHVTAP